MSDVATVDPRRLESLVAFAAIGPILPLFGLDEKGRCRCKRHGNCGTPGKHPIAKLVPTGVKEATSDPAKIAAWLAQAPEANWGIATGFAIGGDAERGYLGVLDVDPRNDGTESLRLLTAQHGIVPQTWQALTGYCEATRERGTHYYLRFPHPPKSCVLADGLEVKGRGGYVVIPPSRHATGVAYEWELSCLPEDIELGAAPAFVTSGAGRALLDGAQPTWTGDDASSTLLGNLFAGYNWLGSPIRDGSRMVRCPWANEHTTKAADGDTTGNGEDSSTAIGPPNSHSRTGWFRCCHAHCTGKHRDEVLRFFGPDNILRAGQKAGIPKAAVERLIVRLGLNVVTHQRFTGGAQATASTRSPSQPPPAPATPPAAWLAGLHRTPRGAIEKSATNVFHILTQHPQWVAADGDPRIRMDMFRKEIVVADPPFSPATTPEAQRKGRRALSGVDFVRIEHWLRAEPNIQTTFKREAIEHAVALTAETARCNSMQDRIESLTWDKTPRLDTWLSRYLRAGDTPYTRLVGAWWLTSVVARALEPGCAIEGFLVLEGKEGCGKSTAIRILGHAFGPDAYAEVTAKVTEPVKFAEAIRGRVIYELAELTSLKGSPEDGKAVITITVDVYRIPFTQGAQSFSRCGVPIGTTNRAKYLESKTGNRRFWPVHVEQCDLAALKEDAEQLIAEAHERYHAGAKWFPSTEEERELCRGEQEHREAPDPWEESISSQLETLKWPPKWSIRQSYQSLRSLGVREANRSNDAHIALILKRLGYEAAKTSGNNSVKETVSVYPMVGNGPPEEIRVCIWHRVGMDSLDTSWTAKK